jgi:TRAP-type uncharacterized transport system substrate-binding protein
MSITLQLKRSHGKQRLEVTSMKEKKLWPIAFALLALALWFRPADGADKKNWGVQSVQIASASQGGGFYALATPLAPIWEKELKIPVVVSTSRGSTENVALIERGEVALAMITGASEAEAWNSEGSFKKRYGPRAKRLRVGFLHGPHPDGAWTGKRQRLHSRVRQL